MTQRESVGAVFKRCKAQGRAALIAFLTAGYPSLRVTPSLAEAACEGGADIIELGFPYSDPLADGPVIQASSQRALEAGADFEAVLDVAARITTAQPLIAFTYYNPLFARGLQRAAKDLADAGFAGAIVPDLPPEESAPLEKALGEHGLCLTLLVAPTTPRQRARDIAARSGEFVYVVSRMGVTGIHAGAAATLCTTIGDLRAATDKPLAVGFGIASPEDARLIAGLADGVIVGSALVKEASSSDPTAGVGRLCRALTAACSRTPSIHSPGALRGMAPTTPR